jgi:hypothetical protein
MARCENLTLNQPGSRKSVNFWGPFSFDIACTRCKLTSPGRWQMCSRVLQFREFSQNGVTILLYLDRARPDLESASPRTLHSPGREIDRIVARRRTPLRTTARPDFSSARVVCNNSKTSRKRVGRNGSAATELLTKKRQNGPQNIIF